MSALPLRSVQVEYAAVPLVLLSSVMGRVRISAEIALVTASAVLRPAMGQYTALKMARVSSVEATATVLPGNSALMEVNVPVSVKVSVSPGGTGDMLVAPI